MVELCDTCPFCRGIPAVGSSPTIEPRTAFDQVLHEHIGNVLVPSLGMIMPGYFLLITKSHLNNYALIGREALQVLDAYLHRLISALSPLFGEYFVFEHGAPEHLQDKSNGGCISHAHLHLIPSANGVRHVILNALSWEQVGYLSQIERAKEVGYALLWLDNCYYLAVSPELPSQWVRRITCECLRTDRHWDWGADFGDEQLKTTLSTLNAQPTFVDGHRVKESWDV